MEPSKLITAVAIGLILSAVTFFQLKKKNQYQTYQLIIIFIVEFFLLAGVWLGVGFLMDQINLFGAK